MTKGFPLRQRNQPLDIVAVETGTTRYEGRRLSTERRPSGPERSLLIDLSNASIARGGRSVLNHVNLTVTTRSRLALVGENGRGKSTLLQVLAGRLKPDSGTVTIVGNIGVADQELPVADRRTVGELVALAIAPSLDVLKQLDEASALLATGTSEAADRYAAALARAEALDVWNAERRVLMDLEALNAVTDMKRRLDELSVGQRYRVRLACLLGGDDDFLLLDEPTNHLDQDSLEFLTDRIVNRRGGVVIVSHDRALIADVAKTIVDLDPSSDGLPRTYGGGYPEYRVRREAERQRWEREYQRQQEQHARLQAELEAAQQRLISGWRPPKGSDKHGRATRAGALVQSLKRRQTALDRHELNVPEPPQALAFPQISARDGEPLLTVDGVRVLGRLGGPVSFRLAAGDRLLLSGPNGSGKSTLLAVTAGTVQPDSGVVRTSKGVRVGLLSQESSLPADARAGELFGAHVERVAALSASGSSPIELSQLGLLDTREANKRVGDLSIGQQRRLDLAMVLAERPSVLLLDEPTNHLSVALVDELAEALSSTRAAVVVATHDRQLRRDLAAWPEMRLIPS